MSGARCPLCNEGFGPFPGKHSAYGYVCRDCYAAHDLGRFEEIAPAEDAAAPVSVTVSRELAEGMLLSDRGLRKARERMAAAFAGVNSEEDA